MKIFTSKYRNHWISPYKIAEKIFFWREIDYDEPIVKKINIVLEPICTAWQNFLDFVHPRFQYIKIDFWDTWSMDHTLADIVLPMLKQLKETKHGAPMTDDEDVPDNLKSINAAPKIEECDTDEFHFERWDWILDEMIWAFEQKVTDDDESKFFDHSENEPGGFPWDKDGNYVSKTKVDWDGLKSHQARKTNGYRLFGKYYEALWD
jgi:hypothetical protein